MRKLGLIGGISWTSTARYYDLINRSVQRELGGLHSATLLIDSLDFADVARCASANDWDCGAGHMVGAAKRLQAAGAEALMICANSLHKVVPQIGASVDLPVIHIIDEIGARLKTDKVKSVALVGTSNVMSDRDYRQHLVQEGGVSLLPAEADLAEGIDKLVYTELAAGIITREAERYMKTELTNIAKEDVQAVVLACTELDLIVDVNANVLPIYDSTTIHAEAGARFVLGK
ncbi:MULTISPECIES: aspartate/glutamate racemase family protein [Sphingobium]|uniref:aspartate/glutamate racemase family protein n=1 Tax=Sphingobium TaxID=165695 RepID=UPI0015EB5D6F|nr:MULTISPECIES: amino acid racemase [Sphingobium]MCW2364090.1 aspartate racemase [Sphingobium sp. B10D3B]MCW2402513.1 aspartate racemase [Sphingobium sp. B10D7B]MCW2409492.1 aspartate racemase [Sphingobium xanthum]